MPHIASMVLSFSFSKFSSSHSRGEASRSRTVSATHAVPRVRHAPKATRSACHDGNGEPSSPKICGASCAERRRHGLPAVGVRRTEARRSAGVRGSVLFHAEPAAIGECGCETPFRADEIEAVREQAILMRGKKRRASKQAQIHRVEIVAKAREGDFAGLDRAAGDARRARRPAPSSLWRQDAAPRPGR